MYQSRFRFSKCLSFALVLGLGMAGSVCSGQSAGRQKRPNLVIVYPDQMRTQSLGFLGEEPVQTPALNRFAAESLVLRSTVANYPLCSPSRAMFMTGKYPFANKVITNCRSTSEPLGVELQEDDRCWSDILKDGGYDLAYIGKWHLDSPRPPYVDCANNKGPTKWNEWCRPERRHGFDYWYSYGTYDYHNRPMYWKPDAARDEFHFVDQWGPEHEADTAIRYIENKGGGYRDPDKPFGMVVAMNPPHNPYDMVPIGYVNQYDEKTTELLCARPNILPKGMEWGDYYRDNIRNYYAMITGVDYQFSRILQSLEDKGLAENTIVVFTSDHGCCLGIHEEGAKNNFYEESLRVPFLIRWPGKIPARQDDLLLSTPDIYPTLLNLMGFAELIPDEVEGTDYADIFRGGEGARPSSQLCMKIIEDKPAYGWRAVRTKTHTLAIVSMPGKSEIVELYDNVQDPYQLTNLADQEPETIALLQEELNRLMEARKDPWLRRHQ